MDLVIMAGGMGSRFGGLKQLSSIDNYGNFIMDYSIYDAIRCGYDRVVFVIRQENFEDFKSSIGRKIEGKIKVKYVFQSPNDYNLKREKPLGTGHAVLITKGVVSDKFAVINADDFYGYNSFKKLYKMLASLSEDEFCSILFKLKNTLSDFGSVSRGIAKVNNNYLESLKECEIIKSQNKVFAKSFNDTISREIDNDTLVSMNMFGFNKKIFEFLEKDLNLFLKDKTNLSYKEFYLPSVITNAIKEKNINVLISKTDEQWQGLTFKQDILNVKNYINKLKANNVYPENLWQD